LAGSTKNTLKTESVEVANEAAGAGTKGQRVTPEVPLECDDRGGEHAGPDEGEGGLSARKTRVEERETRNHDQHHGRSHDDEGLVTRLVPLVQVFGDCETLLAFAGGIPGEGRASGFLSHRTCAKGNDGMHSRESPPVMASVPLNWAGGPVHEYDMVTEFLCGWRRRN
jgi:hypothetical protein